MSDFRVDMLASDLKHLDDQVAHAVRLLTEARDLIRRRLDADDTVSRLTTEIDWLLADLAKTEEGVASDHLVLQMNGLVR